MMQNTQQAMPSICVTNEIGETVPVEERLQPYHIPASDFSEIRAVPPFNEEDTRAIIRQVEYYFSDQNLPSDAHLLGLSGGDGNGPVSLNEVLSFKKMRVFKPRSGIKNVVRQSAVLDISADGKKIQRRFPLQILPRVAPEVDLGRAYVERMLAENPHLTKNMLKPTGFEANFADPPISPEQYERDRKLYDPEFSIHTRLENAIRHYRSRRKMHQETLRVFELWMIFGGIDTSPQAYNGQLNHEDYEPLDKDEIAAQKYCYQVHDYILDNEDEYEVDFEKVALAFLSTEFFESFKHSVAQDARTVCNVMVNFFNFLLHHDVCPEYATQILAARRAVQAAEPALCRVPGAEKSLQIANSFDGACAVLHDEEYDVEKQSYWMSQQKSQLSPEDADIVFKAGISAFATDEQIRVVERLFEEFKTSARAGDNVVAKTPVGARSCLPFRLKAQARKEDDVFQCRSPTDMRIDTLKAVTFGKARVDSSERPGGNTTTTHEQSMGTYVKAMHDQRRLKEQPIDKRRSPLKITCSEEIGLEITGLEPAGPTLDFFFDRLEGSLVPKLGLMHCRRWESPNAAPTDLPADRPRLPQEFTFIVVEDVLESCDVGMKLEAYVRQLDIGICWIDRLVAVYPTFYTTICNFKDLKKRREEINFLAEWLADRKERKTRPKSDDHTIETQAAQMPAEIEV